MDEPRAPYAHAGRRRRRITEELFRCMAVEEVHGQQLTCNCLLWKHRPEQLREHLKEHVPDFAVESMSDDRILAWYTQARRIAVEGIPDRDDE